MPPRQGLVTWLDSPQARTLKTRKKAQLCFWGRDANSSLSPSCPSYHPAPLCRVPAPQADGKGRLQRALKAQDHKAEPQIKANGPGRGVEGELRTVSAEYSQRRGPRHTSSPAYLVESSPGQELKCGPLPGEADKGAGACETGLGPLPPTSLGRPVSAQQPRGQGESSPTEWKRQLTIPGLAELWPPSTHEA